MSIYIKNMNMPKTVTTFVVFPNGYVACFDIKDNFIAETRAIDVPPHGDLVDAQEILSALNSSDFSNYEDYEEAFDVVSQLHLPPFEGALFTGQAPLWRGYKPRAVSVYGCDIPGVR